MSTNGASAIPSDRELKQLAAEPARPLFPLLDQAESMVPLVVVLAFLPSLYALVNGTLTEWGALQGLAGIDCLTTGGPVVPSDVAVPGQSDLLRFQPPLMGWMTALGMRIAGAGQALGALAPAFLCTAGLVMSGYILGRRLGGERLGLVSAGLLAFNPLILAGGQEPVPQSAAVLAAVLALAGVVTHWQKSSSLVSYQLLTAGIALGLCLLSGGAIAVAVLAVVLLYVLLWKCTDRRVARSGIVSDRIRFSRRMALRSTLVLAATAFAVGGWEIMFLSSRYGSEFWDGWLASTGIHFSEGQRSLGFDRLWGACRVALPLAGLTAVGMCVAVRDIYRGDEEAARRHRGLLLVWIAVALGLALWTGVAPAGADASQIWGTFLTVALVITAALGILQIAERRVGFALALSGCAISLAAVAAGRWLPTQNAVGLLAASVPVIQSLPDLVAAVLAAVSIIGVGWFVARGYETRRRAVLSGLLLAIVLVYAGWGMGAVRRTEVGDRELQELRAGLERLVPYQRLVLVDLSPAGDEDKPLPPPQLLFVLRSLQPVAEVRYVTSWEAARRESETRQPASTADSLFVSLSAHGRGRSSGPAAGLKAATPPLQYRDLDVVAFISDRVSASRTAEAAELRSSNN